MIASLLQGTAVESSSSCEHQLPSSGTKSHSIKMKSSSRVWVISVIASMIAHDSAGLSHNDTAEIIPSEPSHHQRSKRSLFFPYNAAQGVSDRGIKSLANENKCPLMVSFTAAYCGNRDPVRRPGSEHLHVVQF